MGLIFRVVGHATSNQTPVVKEPLDDVASNLILHLDATNIDGANNETLTESEEIITWTDLSGNNNHGAKSNNNAKPQYESDGFNGLASVYFDGSDALKVNNNTPFKMQEFTIFIVGIPRNVQDNESDCGVGYIWQCKVKILAGEFQDTLKITTLVFQ